MRTFTDNANRTWQVALNVTTIKRVKETLDVDLLGVLDGTLLEQLGNDPIMLCNVLYVACKPQADSLGVTDEQFGEGLCGDAIDRAADCLLKELVDFFPIAKRRVLAEMLAKLTQYQDKAYQAIQTVMDSPKLMTGLEAMMSRAEKEAESELDLLIAGK